MAFLTMNVRRGSVYAVCRSAAWIAAREYPRFVASCMAVRPWCDLCIFVGR
jgi:hypothetical protein